jgi:hypothetical protein
MIEGDRWRGALQHNPTAQRFVRRDVAKPPSQ